MVDGEIFIDVAGRDEEVVVGLGLEHLRRGTDHPRHVARGVDDRVPLPSLQDAKAAVPVADQLLDARKEARIGLAAIEERRHVASGLSRPNHVGTDESGPADEQDPKRSLPPKREGRGSDRERGAGDGGGLDEIASSSH